MSVDMAKLNDTQRAVIARLDEEYKTCRTAGSHGGQLNGPVLNVLKGFCASDTEFAQLLHDSDKDLKGCFEAVSRQGYSGTSDFEVYSNAIRYYLPGVTVHMTLWVDMQGVDEGVAFGRDGEATLDVYGKGKVKERAEKASGQSRTPAPTKKESEDKPKKGEKTDGTRTPSGTASGATSLPEGGMESGKAKVLPVPDVAKQQTPADLFCHAEPDDELLDMSASKPKKILGFDFLDL